MTSMPRKPSAQRASAPPRGGGSPPVGICPAANPELLRKISSTLIIRDIRDESDRREVRREGFFSGETCRLNNQSSSGWHKPSAENHQSERGLEMARNGQARPAPLREGKDGKGALPERKRKGVLVGAVWRCSSKTEKAWMGWDHQMISRSGIVGTENGR